MIICSSLICQEEREAHATALFHYNEGTIIAEVVALNQRRHRLLWRFLENLSPRQAQWTIPRDCVIDHQKRQWADVRFIFAVVVDKEIPISSSKTGQIAQRGNIFLHVWGFGSWIDDALAHVLNTISSSTSHSVVESAKAIPNGIEDSEAVDVLTAFQPTVEAPTHLASVNACTISSEFVASLDKERSNAAKSSGKSSNSSGSGKGATFHGTFVFQDREAGIFYQTFEEDFRNFIAYKFNVSITETASGINDGGSVGTSITPSKKSGMSASGAAARAPALKVDFTGSSSRDVTCCRSYLEQLNTSNLLRHQVYFPRTDATKYKDLLNHKV